MKNDHFSFVIIQTVSLFLFVASCCQTSMAQVSRFLNPETETEVAHMLLVENPNLGLSPARPQKMVADTFANIRQRLIERLDSALYARPFSQENLEVVREQIRQHEILAATFASKDAAQALVNWLTAVRAFASKGMDYRTGLAGTPRFASYFDDRLSRTALASVSCEIALTKTKGAFKDSALGISVASAIGGIFYLLSQLPSIPGPPGCFVAGTPIATSKGVKAIEKLKAGDTVVTYNLKTKRLASRKVLAVMDHGIHATFIVKTKTGVTLEVSESHPFYVPSKKLYIKVADLKPGYDLYLKNGARVSGDKVLSISSTGQKRRVYNLEVQQTHNYFAAGVLVHNFRK